MKKSVEEIRIKEFLERWDNAAKEIASIEKGEKSVDISTAMELLEDAFLSAVYLNPPKAYSGLIEQQKFFQRLKDENTD